MPSFITLLLLVILWICNVGEVSAQFSGPQPSPVPGSPPAAPPGTFGQAPATTPQPSRVPTGIVPPSPQGLPGQIPFPGQYQAPGQPAALPGIPSGQQPGGFPAGMTQPPQPPSGQPPVLFPSPLPQGGIPQPVEGQPPSPATEAPPAQTISPGEAPPGFPAQPLSSIEASFAGPVPQTRAVPLRQFGYDLFAQRAAELTGRIFIQPVPQFQQPQYPPQAFPVTPQIPQPPVLAVPMEVRQPAPQLSPRGFAPPVDLPVGPDYIVGPGDSVLVRSWGSFFFDYNLVVARNGQIFLPDIGPVNVAGLNFAEVERLIRQAFATKYQDIQLSITIGQLRSITVFVVGEVVQPGSYQLSSVSTLLHALFAAGGPTKQGTLRRIQLSRGPQVIGEADLYRLLLQGDQSQDYRLQSGDTIFVPLIGKVSGIAGNVKRPAIYELKGETSLQELITMAGGITPFGYTQTIQVERAQGHERKVILDLNLEQALRQRGPAQTLVLQDADLIRISPISALIQNQVELVGNVERPGRYEFKEGMRISDLLQLGKQLLPETYMRRAEIERLVPPDNHMEIVSIELGALLRGDKSQDLFLQAQDRVLIYSVYDFQDQPVVRVTGAVRRPGEYRLFPEMTIRDLIFRAGGLSRRAYTLEAELSRIVSAHEQQTPARTILIPIQLAEALNGNPIANIRLQELDTLFIRNLPEWVAIVNKVVQLSGEVKFPGEYAFEQGERLSSVIRRAGGFTEQAFPKGAVFTREAVRLEQEQQLREVLELAQVEALQLGVEAAGAETEEQRAVRQQAVSAQRQLLEIIAARRPTGRMVIRLHDPDTLEGTPDDVELQPGDRLYVPPIPSSINVVGGVFRAGAVVFLEGAGLDYYLDRVGGLTDFAVEKKIRLIKANGTVLELKGKRRGNPFFRRSRFAEDREGQIELGDTIFVPVKFEEEIQVVALTQTLVDVMFKTAVTIAAIVAAF